MHAIFLCAWINILPKLGQIREVIVFMESWEHAGHVWVHIMTQEHKLACMHATFLHSLTYILVKFGQIREVKVSMEWGEHVGHVWVHNMAQTHELACLLPILLNPKLSPNFCWALPMDNCLGSIVIHNPTLLLLLLSTLLLSHNNHLLQRPTEKINY